MARIYLNKIEFYITNVCNLTCEYCNRFNNLNFKGWQDWNYFKQVYTQWSELLEIEKIVIMGGEPLLNPTILSWAEGLNELWNKPVQILSNGTRINHVKNLYEVLRTKSIWIGVTMHNKDHAQELLSEIEFFLQAPFKKLIGKENNIYGADITYTDMNNVCIPVWVSDDFLQNAIIKNNKGRWTLHDSDPLSAHDICCFAQAKNYHFVKGKLYKCGPVALLPELDQQLTLDLFDQDRYLLNSYQPLTLENFQNYHREFFDKLDDPIPQCKFCPSYGGGGKIWPIRKGLV